MLDAQQSPTQVTATQPTAQTAVNTKSCCNSAQGCETCSKDAKSMKPEALSFISLFLIGLTTVLGVLLFNEKQAKSAQILAQPDTQALPTVVKYEKPSLKAVREVINLPAAKLKGTVSLEETIQARRSRRLYSDESVTQQELAQVLWSAQGITDELGHRAAPSARSAYPYSIYVVVRDIAGVNPGLYVYNPTDHTLENLGLVNAGDRLTAAGVQDNSQKAPVVLALVAAPALMQEKAPDSDPMPSIYLEGGHIGQNISLQIESLKMATVMTGGFDKQAVAQALELNPLTEIVVYLVPFGNIGTQPAQETN